MDKTRKTSSITKSYVVCVTREGREKLVVLHKDGVSYEINFAKMEELLEHVPDKDKESEPVRVIRQNKIKCND